MPILDHWQHHATAPENHLILPDGCMDLICSVDSNGKPTWFISDLANCAYSVAIEKNEKTYGLRLRTGVHINRKGLLASINQHTDVTDISKNITEFVRINQNVDDALAVLRIEPNVTKASKVLGVSARSLQRLLVKYTYKPPSFWLRLGKIRACAQQMVNSSDMPKLVEHAYNLGFSDQAHMNHEFKHWFGMTPQQFTNRNDMIEAINASGYGTKTKHT